MSSLKTAAPALFAALLFGAGTPLAKLLVGEMPALLLAGLLYLGSGLGLGLVMLGRRVVQRGPARPGGGLVIPAAERPWLLGAIVSGGMLGPVLLMLGLAGTDGASASLLLNMEAVLTAALAWLVFGENADRGVVAGMVAIVLGGVLLSWQAGGVQFSGSALLIVAACACWAIDNNLTRKVSGNDAMLIACLKGLVAGVCNTVVGLIQVWSGRQGLAAELPGAASVAAAMALGFFAYGLSLVLFVRGLRVLGAARTGAWFSVAPLFGVMLSLLLWPAMPGPLFWLAAALMAWGMYMHVRERHEHTHTHEVLTHSHNHRHDAHHQHTHPEGWDGMEPHSHTHTHEALTHSHAHYPDIHHRHRHG